MSFFFYHSDRFVTHVKLINNRIENFTLKRLFEMRLYQIIIFNNYNSFNVLFGEGFGKYNALTSSPGMKQPDAPYIMVYNEGGLIGLLIFLNLFYQIFIYSLKSRNYFLLFVVTHFSIEMVGSRILWNFPINYLFYSLIGMFQIVSSRKVSKG